MTGVAPLANAELALMELLWNSDRQTARDLRNALYPDATKAQHGTVQKLLKRLEDKGFVTRDRDLAVHFFSPAISREAYGSSRLESLAERLTDGSLAPLITQLVEDEKLSRAEIDRLRRILGEA